MGKINKKDVKIFNHLGEVVDDVLMRCIAIVSAKELVLEAIRLDNQSESFAIDCMGKQHEVEVGFSTTCDTEHCIVFEVCDKEFRIKHHQDQFQCYDKMPIVITELTALAESLLGAVADYWADVPHDKRVKLDAGLAGIIKRLDNAAYVATEDDPSQTSVDVFNDVLAELLDAIKPPMDAALVWGEGKPPPYEGGKATFYEKEKHYYSTAVGNYHFEIEPTRCLDGYEIYVGDGVNRVEFPVGVQYESDAKRLVEFLNDTPDLLVRLNLGGAT